MMKRNGWLLGMLAFLLLMVIFNHFFAVHSIPASSDPVAEKSPTLSQAPPNPEKPTASETLLDGYADPATPPLDDLRKIHRVAIGYFSLIKDASRFPIGGNADFASALRGENPNREVFIRPGNPVFSADGLLVDRWGSPLIVHPVAWQQLELRSSGPDRVPYNSDDLVLSPVGVAEP
jgi:hypothetical protein